MLGTKETGISGILRSSIGETPENSLQQHKFGRIVTIEAKLEQHVTHL